MTPFFNSFVTHSAKVVLLREKTKYLTKKCIKG